MGVQNGGVVTVFVPIVLLGLFYFWRHQRMLELLKMNPKEILQTEWRWWSSWTVVFLISGVGVFFPGLFLAFTKNDWGKWVTAGGATALILANICYEKAELAGSIFRSL